MIFKNKKKKHIFGGYFLIGPEIWALDKPEARDF